MLSRENKQRILVILAVGLVLGLIYIKAVRPFFKNLRDKAAQLGQKKLLVEKSRAVINEREALLLDFSDLSRKIQARLPLERGESKFLNAVGEVAQSTNVYIQSMNALPLRDLGFFRELSVEIDMEANLGNLVRFLYQMRKSSVVLVANRLSLEPKAEGSALLKGHLIISTIFIKE